MDTEPGVESQVVQAQAHELRNTKTCCIGQVQHGAIANTFTCIQPRRIEQRLHFFPVEIIDQG
jgi:hypothetical protein